MLGARRIHTNSAPSAEVLADALAITVSRADEWLHSFDPTSTEQETCASLLAFALKGNS